MWPVRQWEVRLGVRLDPWWGLLQGMLWEGGLVSLWAHLSLVWQLLPVWGVQLEMVIPPLVALLLGPQ